jgi:putative transposase
MAEALWSGRRFRTFNVNDDFNRESLRIEIGTSLPSQRVIRALDELVELRGAPRRLRLDYGPEFISAALRQWAQQHGIELIHIQPGKPTQNAYIERFNRTFDFRRKYGNASFPWAAVENIEFLGGYMRYS